MKKKMKKTWQ